MYLALGALALAASIASLPVAIPNMPKYVALFGLGWAIAVLAANLGSRAWRNLNFKPCGWSRSWYSPLSFVGVYLISAVVGITVPFLGHKKVQLGGVVAIRSIIFSSFITVVVFVISDLDFLLAYLITIAEVQVNKPNAVTAIIATWWTLATIISLCFCRRIPVKEFKPEQGALLVASNASPVGYCVPYLPNYVIKTVEHRQGSKCAEWAVISVAIMVAVIAGAAIMALGFSSEIQNVISNQ